MGAGDCRAGGGASDRPVPFSDFDDVDLRDPEAGSLTVSEWLDESGAAAGPGTARRRTLARRARGTAEQAIEKSVIPSRYHDLIRRYFGRLEETVENAEPAEKP